MKRRNQPLTFGLLLLSGALAGPLSAQTLPAPATSPAPTTPVPALPAARPAGNQEEIVELSPFEVSASKNIGYQTTETLAGNRVRTDLKDIGSAISVANQAFLQDTGATSNLTLLQYMTNTEIGGVGGNFGGLGDSSVLDDSNQRMRPNSNTRVRGLDSADNTRDFYLTDIPWDAYNTSRVDIQRGANSILFGNGSGAGIINGGTDSAMLGKNSGVVEARYGSYGSYRGSININHDLIPGQLALRVATLYDKTVYQQDPAYNLDRRYYAALRFEPKFLSKGSAHTVVKMSFENGKVDSNRPRTSTPMDEISPWFLTGNSVMNAPTAVNARGDTTLGTIYPMTSHAGYDPFVVAVNNAALIAANPTRKDIGAYTTYTDGYQGAGFTPPYGTNGKPNANSEPWITFGSNNGVNGDWQGSPAAIYLDPNSSQMAGYLATRTNGTYYAINSAGVRDGSIAGLRGPEFDGILKFDDYAATRNFLYQGSGVYRATSLSDPTFFDFFNKLLDGPNKKEFSNFQAFNASIDQTFFNDMLGFQLAIDKQSYVVGQDSELGGGPMIGMDIWSYLPVATVVNGQLQAVANPNFGRPFTVSGRGTFSRSETKRQVLRLTPYLDLNFKDLFKVDNTLTKILGRSTFTGLLERSTYDSENKSGPHNSLSQAQATALFGPSQTITGSATKIVSVSYLGPSLATASTMAGANISNIAALQEPGNGLLTYFNSNYLPNASAPGAIYTPPAIGISPSAVGGNPTTQSENPANYVGWSTPTPIAVNNVDVNGLTASSASAIRQKTTSKAAVDEWTLLNGSLVLMGGIRKDTIDTYLPNSNGIRTGTTYGIVDWSAPFIYPSTPTLTYTSDLLKTYSIVLKTPGFINKHLPWGLNASVFYSHSDNFKPVNRIDIFGTQLAPPSGETKDYGVRIGALDERISLKITRYKTTVSGAGGDVNDAFSNNMRQRIGDEIRHAIQDAYYVKLHVGSAGYSQSDPFDPTGALSPTGGYAATPTIHADGSSITSTSPATQADWIKTEQNLQLAAQDALDKSLPTGSKALPGTAAMLATYNMGNPGAFSAWTPGTALNFAYPSTLSITQDTLSTGTEYELYLQPTQNWNITVNASKQFATRSNLSAAVKAWVLGRWALYTDPAQQPAGESAATPISIGDIPWFGAGQTVGDNASRVNTEGTPRFGRNAWAYYNLESAQEGNAVPELRPWSFNLVTTYNFNQGALKGAFVGGGYRWQDSDIIGYGVTEVTPQITSVNQAVGKLDPNKPFYGPKQHAVDLWVGYNQMIWKNVNYRVQINASNFGQKTHLAPLNTNPDGSIASWRIINGTTWTLTNRFEF
jgi:outer membrane receptor protein involved in Fe transport